MRIGAGAANQPCEAGGVAAAMAFGLCGEENEWEGGLEMFRCWLAVVRGDGVLGNKLELPAGRIVGR